MPPWTVSKPVFSSPLAFVGYQSALSSGTDISGSTSANTKGSWVELIASTFQPSDGLFLYLGTEVATTHVNYALIDLAVGGAGSEVPLVENIPMAGRRTSSTGVFIPIAIPAGVRLSTRSQALGTGIRGYRVGATLLPRSYTHSNANRCQFAYTYGYNLADSGGVQVDPGAAANTKGAYSEIVASTAAPIRYLLAFFNLINNNTATSSRFLIDIAIGGAGSERIVLHDIPVGELPGSDSLTPAMIGPVPMSIPAGTRLSARAQCTITDATDRLFDVILIGVG